MSLFQQFYGSIVAAYEAYSRALGDLADDARCNFRIAAWGSARKSGPKTAKLTAAWARQGWDTVTGGGPGEMQSAALGAYQERSKMIEEKFGELFKETLALRPELHVLDIPLFDEAVKTSKHMLDATADQIEGLKVEKRTAMFHESVCIKLRERLGADASVEVVHSFDEASAHWAQELRWYAREQAKILSCALYFPMEPPNVFADGVLVAMDFPSRLRLFEALCSAFVILPYGGIGTLLELMLAVQWVQLLSDERNLKANPAMLPINRAVQSGYRPPIVVMNVPMWAMLKLLLVVLWMSGTIKREDINLIHLAVTPEQANTILKSAHAEWVKHVMCDVSTRKTDEEPAPPVIM